MDISKFRTETVDKTKASEAVEYFYTNFLEMKVPTIHFVKSPMEAQLLLNELVNEITSNSSTDEREFFDFFYPTELISRHKHTGRTLAELISHMKQMEVPSTEIAAVTTVYNNMQHFHQLFPFDQFAVIVDFPQEILAQEQDSNEISVIYRDETCFAIDVKHMRTNE